MDFIIRPIYRVWGEFIPELNETFFANLDVGKAYDWDAFFIESQEAKKNNNAIMECDTPLAPERTLVVDEGASDNDPSPALVESASEPNL